MRTYVMCRGKSFTTVKNDSILLHFYSCRKREKARTNHATLMLPWFCNSFYVLLPLFSFSLLLFCIDIDLRIFISQNFISLLLSNIIICSSMYVYFFFLCSCPIFTSMFTFSFSASVRSLLLCFYVYFLFHSFCPIFSALFTFSFSLFFLQL
jgi:hypothetical protein